MPSKADLTALMERAKEARKRSYSPYSGFAVGAAILSGSGEIYSGCNIENASYPASICAERAALSCAITNGEKSIIAVAVAGGKSGCDPKLCPPCGICRQALREFADPDSFIIVLDDGRELLTRSLSELLPMSFGPSSLE